VGLRSREHGSSLLLGPLRRGGRVVPRSGYLSVEGKRRDFRTTMVNAFGGGRNLASRLSLNRFGEKTGVSLHAALRHPKPCKSAVPSVGLGLPARRVKVVEHWCFEPACQSDPDIPAYPKMSPRLAREHAQENVLFFGCPPARGIRRIPWTRSSRVSPDSTSTRRTS
jgi:hypothetical protein